MILALGELETLGKKASRGAGFSWGEAEEAGQALRILAASGLPAASLFTRYLQAVEAERAAPAICPIRLGCALVDGTDLGTFACAFPALLMPFVARRAASQGQAIALAGSTFRGCAGPDLAITIKAPAASCNALSLEPASSSPELTRIYRAHISTDDVEALNGFAHRTYAPETAERRAAGAGAGDDGNA